MFSSFAQSRGEVFLLKADDFAIASMAGYRIHIGVGLCSLSQILERSPTMANDLAKGFMPFKSKLSPSPLGLALYQTPENN